MGGGRLVYKYKKIPTVDSYDRKLCIIHGLFYAVIPWSLHPGIQ